MALYIRRRYRAITRYGGRDRSTARERPRFEGRAAVGRSRPPTTSSTSCSKSCRTSGLPAPQRPHGASWSRRPHGRRCRRQTPSAPRRPRRRLCQCRRRTPPAPQRRCQCHAEPVTLPAAEKQDGEPSPRTPEVMRTPTKCPPGPKPKRAADAYRVPAGKRLKFS